MEREAVAGEPGVAPSGERRVEDYNKALFGVVIGEAHRDDTAFASILLAGIKQALLTITTC